MYKIVIIGGGFAGLSSVHRLCKYAKDLDITLIDQGKESVFLPLLPDVIGRGISWDYLACNLGALSKKIGFKFINDGVRAIDLSKKEVSISSQALPYDYLLIASGSETNFYGNEQIKRYAYKLDDAQDARKIRRDIEKDKFDCFVISGGGYTGIEVATNLRTYLNKKAIDKRVIIVERAPSILGPLPEWMKTYVKENLKILNIEYFTNTAIEKIEENKVSLQGGIALNNPMVIWTAGVKTSGFIQDLKIEKNPQGRIKVDEYLRLNDTCFAVGDAAYFSYKNNFLRMAVQFAIMQGDSAAINIINCLCKSKLRKYKPVDFGYIIPMANNRSCGIILGVNLKGILPTILHYLMCIYRTQTFKNKLGIIRDLLKGGGLK